jgi:hypothetical protein
MEEVANCIAAYLRDMSIFDSQSKGPELYGHKSKGMSIMGTTIFQESVTKKKIERCQLCGSLTKEI